MATCPPRISNLLRPFWGETQELDDQLPNLVIVFEAKLNARTIKRCRSKAREKNSLATIFIHSLLCGAERYKY